MTKTGEAPYEAAQLTRHRSQDDASQVSQAGYERLVETSPDAIIIHNGRRILFANTAAARLVGVERTPEMIVRSLRDFVHPDDRQIVMERGVRMTKGEVLPPVELRIVRLDGSEIEVEANGTVIAMSDGSKAIQVVIRDLTERNRMQARLKEMSMALESAVEGISRIDRQGRYASVNAAYARMLGYEPSELIGADWLETVHRNDHPTMQLARKELVASGRAEAEVRGRRKDGSEFHQRLVLVAVLEGKRKLTGHYQFMQDISARKFNEEMIRHMAYHDPLTNLPNRRLLYDRFRMALAQARRMAQSLAVVSIDIDDFKRVNDTLGHAAGDHVLRTFARRLEGALREGDTLGRVGGDEFLLLLPNADRSGAAIVIQRCRESGAAKIMFERRTVYARFSAGVSVFPEDGDDPDALMKAADAAMYLVKLRGT